MTVNPLSAGRPDPASPSTSQAQDSRRTLAPLLIMVACLQVIAWGMLVLVVLPQHVTLGKQAFGLGLGVTAFVLGARHAFDADHIVAIDGTTRKLLADGREPASVGFWFAAGHSTVVVLISCVVASSTFISERFLDDGSGALAAMSVGATAAAGCFLVMLGVTNIATMRRLVRSLERPQVEEDIGPRGGIIYRALTPVTSRINRPWHIYPVGFALGLGMDTSTEIVLLTLAGTGAASGLPWYVILTLPLLFSAGMTLFDTLNCIFVRSAYRWSSDDQDRRRRLDVLITGFSVVAALTVGIFQIASALSSAWPDLHAQLAQLDLAAVGITITALLGTVWLSGASIQRVATRRDNASST